MVTESCRLMRGATDAAFEYIFESAPKAMASRLQRIAPVKAPSAEASRLI